MCPTVGGSGGSLVRKIRTTTIAIVAVGLLAGSAAGVTAQDQSSGYFMGSFDESTATELEGTYEPGPPDTGRGGGFVGATVETDDERISGTLSMVGNFNWPFVAEPQLVHTGASLWRIENDGGAWVGCRWRKQGGKPGDCRAFWRGT